MRWRCVSGRAFDLGRGWVAEFELHVESIYGLSESDGLETTVIVKDDRGILKSHLNEPSIAGVPDRFSCKMPAEN